VHEVDDVAESEALAESVSYFSRLYSVYSRPIASPIPRLIGFGMARPYREVQ
jgi:hypothetical protein